MTVAEAAEAPGVSTQTVYNYINSGILPAQRAGSRYTLRAGDVTNLAKKLERAASRQSR
jgi:excisionase family DNA binding protein